MSERQHQRLTSYFAIEFAKGDNRAGKGNSAYEYAKIDLNIVNGFFNAFKMHVWIKVTGKANQHCGQADKTVEDGHKLRHLRHLHTRRHEGANTTAD